MLLVLPALLAACSLIQMQALPTATPAPQSTKTTQPSATPEEEGLCKETGSVERHEIQSTLMNDPQYMSVYLPPCYNDGLAGGYPVLYTFHGQTFDDRMWFDLGAVDIADDLILSGESEPFIMVSIFEEFYYRAVTGNKFPDAVIQEVIPWVDTTFNTCVERGCRAVGGISRGAAWAMRIGFNYWQLFSAVGIHSLPSFLGGPDGMALWLNGIPKDQYPRVTMDSGRFDPEVKTAIRCEAVLNEKGVPHAWHLNEGRHDMEYWRAHIGEYMHWYASLWDALE